MPQNEVEPASPCRRQCSLSERNICTGCGRTVAEISGWRAMTVAEKQKCVDDAEVRLDMMDVFTD